MEVAIEAHPASMTIAELLSKVAGDTQDHREVHTITCAVGDLKGWGLLQAGRGEQVEANPGRCTPRLSLAGLIKVAADLAATASPR
jgi:hypothetical protein